MRLGIAFFHALIQGLINGVGGGLRVNDYSSMLVYAAFLFVIVVNCLLGDFETATFDPQCEKEFASFCIFVCHLVRNATLRFPLL